MILVAGGTGMLGEPVARRLCQEGWRVRILTRAPEAARVRFGPEFELVGGDVDDPQSLETAMQGCAGVHISLYGGSDVDLERRGAAALAETAAKLGVERITYLSGASVFEENCWYPGTRARFEAEVAIRQTGVPYTIFCATWFMEALHRFVRGNAALLMGQQPHPIHWVAAADFADMVARAYALPETRNKRLFVHGPEAYTLGQALERFCAIAHPQARLINMPFWMADLFAALGNRSELKAALPFFRYASQVREGGDPTEANTLLGAPTTTLEQWSHAQQTA
jgi:NADH dehydrogenase